MLILAIDTSGEACAVGTDFDGRRTIRSEVIGRGHGERLFAMLRAAADESGAAMSDFERFAVVVGPGSFTGLRVGIAAARGLALATGAPALGVTTFAVHAASSRRGGAGGGPLLVLLPSRGDLVYGQLFAVPGTPAGEPRLAPAADFASQAQECGATLAGPGARPVGLLLGQEPLPATPHPDMNDLLDLARDAKPPLAPPHPLYLSQPDARPTALAGSAA